MDTTIVHQLTRNGETKTDAKSFQDFMLKSPKVSVDGQFLWSYKDIDLKGEIKNKRLAPGVLYVWVEKWDIEQKKVDIRLTTCAYKPAYAKCSTRIVEGQTYCEEHKKAVCTCGKQATHECTYCNPYNAGYPSCQAPLCDDNCKHNCR